MFDYFVWVYGNQVIKGLMKFEDVPARLQDDVKEYLSNKGYGNLCR